MHKPFSLFLPPDHDNLDLVSKETRSTVIQDCTGTIITGGRVGLYSSARPQQIHRTQTERVESTEGPGLSESIVAIVIVRVVFHSQK